MTGSKEVIRISQVSQSMGAIGDSYNNAMGISLWAIFLKKRARLQKSVQNTRGGQRQKYLIGSISITTDDDI